MGPSWYLMPDVSNSSLRSLTKNQKIIINSFDSPGLPGVLSIKMKSSISHQTLRRTFSSLTISKRRPEQLKKYLQAAEYQYTIAMKEFIYKEYLISGISSAPSVVKR